MESTSSIQSKKQSEDNYRIQQESLKNEKKIHQRKYENLVKENESSINKVNKDYESKLATQNIEVDKKLQIMRQKQAERIFEEQRRQDVELEQLKKAHLDKKAELKYGQEQEILNMVESHNNQLENAKKQFDKRLGKYPTS